jgi:putative esterase
MIKKLAILMVVPLMVLVFYSCSERDNTIVSTDYNRGILYSGSSVHYLTSYLNAEMFEQHNIAFQIYTPYGYKDPSLGEPVPVLYLLAPYGGDQDYYINHGLVDIADRMIGTGEIRPMVIVSISGLNKYGGYFYGNQSAGGLVAQAIGDIVDPVQCFDGLTATLLDYFNCALNTLPENRGYRAISGIGVGGYGAMRIALEYSENFSSVSAISAPLDFDGIYNNTGFKTLFTEIMDEFPDDPDSLEYYYRRLKYDINKPLQSMIFAAAVAYSPHDSGIVDTVNVINDPDSYFSETATEAFHLPFDETGQVRDNIWNLWQRNSIQNIVADYIGAFDTLDVMLGYSWFNHDYGFNEQTKSIRYLLERTYGLIPGTDFDTLFYEGYTGYDATYNQYTYDLLPKILKYHSDHFEVIE